MQVKRNHEGRLRVAALATAQAQYGDRRQQLLAYAKAHDFSDPAFAAQAMG
jgi:hypothetical protein